MGEDEEDNEVDQLITVSIEYEMKPMSNVMHSIDSNKPLGFNLYKRSSDSVLN